MWHRALLPLGLLTLLAAGTGGGGGGRSRPVTRASSSGPDSAWWAQQRARSECLQRQRRSINAQNRGQQTWRYTGSC
jgi:hypothetical protein